MAEYFGNYGTIIGTVSEIETKDIKNRKHGLGKITLNVGDAQGYVNIWNPKKAESNKVVDFVKKVNEGDKVQIQGSIDERIYNGDYNRNLNAFVSADNGVRFRKAFEDENEKFVAALSGSVLERNMSYEVVERFDTDEIAVIELKFVIFNLFKPNSEDEFTKQQVIINEMKNYKEYLQDSDKDVEKPLKTLNKLIQKSENGKYWKALNKFYDLFHSNMYNIDILHLTAYKDIAEEIAEKIDDHDNISVGVQVNNYQDVDEFGFIDGYINELQIKKLKKIHTTVENDDFLDDDWENDEW